MRVIVYETDNLATLVTEGSQEAQYMSELPHMRRVADHECDGIDEGIEWFREWSTEHFGGDLTQISV